MAQADEELEGVYEKEEDPGNATEEVRGLEGNGARCISISRSCLNFHPQYLHIDSGADRLVPSSKALPQLTPAKDAPQPKVLSEHSGFAQRSSYSQTTNFTILFMPPLPATLTNTQVDAIVPNTGGSGLALAGGSDKILLAYATRRPDLAHDKRSATSP